MKRALITLIFIVFSLAAFAQERYVVYDCGPDARIFRSSTRAWDALVKGESLQENTVLHVRQKGALKILDKDTRRIYSNAKTGKQTVSSLIKASAKSSYSTFGNLNRQLAKNVKNSDHRGRYYSTYGATTRSEGELSYADSLYFDIYRGIHETASPETLRLVETKDLDGSVSFTVINDSDTRYYVTIIYGNESHLEPVLSEGIFGADVIPVSPRSSANLLSYKFIAPTGSNKYFLIASSREFWMEPLKNALRYMVAPDYSADAELVKVIPAK